MGKGLGGTRSVKFRFIEDLLGLFHHYHHGQDEHKVHHCEHVPGLEIIHCGCLTINGGTQHAINKEKTECMVHLPDLTGIPAMDLVFNEKCPHHPGWYHIGSLATKVLRIKESLFAVVRR